VSYEDSFEREADDERKFAAAESSYIFDHMRPANIGFWTWHLMFDRFVYHERVADTIRDAKEMAVELQTVTVVERSISGNESFACPANYLKKRYLDGSLHRRYQDYKYHFLRLLVVHKKYPSNGILNGSAGYGALSHYQNELENRRHRWWKENYESLSESEKMDFDRGPFPNPFPAGFWTSETYQAALS
jgi:hypothetical protein